MSARRVVYDRGRATLPTALTARWQRPLEHAWQDACGAHQGRLVIPKFLPKPAPKAGLQRLVGTGSGLVNGC